MRWGAGTCTRVLRPVGACARGLGVAVEGRERGRREASAERLVDVDLHLVLLVDEGVDVAAVALRDPALAGLVVERAVDFAAARPLRKCDIKKP